MGKRPSLLNGAKIRHFYSLFMFNLKTLIPSFRKKDTSQSGQTRIENAENTSARFLRVFPSIRNDQRNVIIDSLRGLSILMVVFAHFSLLGLLTGDHYAKVFGRTVANIGNGMGYYGVGIFFVISGFLITRISIKRYGALPSIDFTNFWWLRFSRIMPLLFVCLLTITLFHLFSIKGFVFKDTLSLGRTVTAILSFRFDEVLNYQPPNGAWNPMWSLSVEEMFYLAFPFVCLCLNGPASVLWVMIVVIASSSFFRLSGHGYYSTLGCVDYLAVGCTCAILRIERLHSVLSDRLCQWVGIGLLGLGLTLSSVCILIWFPIHESCETTLLCSLGAALVLLSSQLIRINKLIRWALMPFSVLGVVSYEVYLIHLPLGAYLYEVGKYTGWYCFFAVIIISIFTHECFSEPMNKTLREISFRKDNPAHTRKNLKKWFRCALLSIAPVCSIIFAIVLVQWLGKPVNISIRLKGIKTMPAGVGEPIVYIGQMGAADLIFLRHEDNGRVNIGISHWGLPLKMGTPMEASTLEGKTLDAKFANDGITVSLGDKVLVKMTEPRHSLSKFVTIGVNDIKFSYVNSKSETLCIRIK